VQKITDSVTVAVLIIYIITIVEREVRGTISSGIDAERNPHREATLLF